MNNKLHQKNAIGRPKTFDKDEIIKLAMYHFWEHGYDNSSLDDLLIVMGIKKSSFYRTFKSKEQLFSSCLALYREEMSAQMEKLKLELGPKKAMLTLTNETIEQLKKTGTVKGCLLINSGQECYNKYSDLSNQINVEFNFMQDLFVGFITQAQRLGEISNTKKAEVIAGRYMNILNGLVVTIQAGASKDLIENIVESLREMLE